MAKRIQRKRTKGWRMPDGAVYVGRGSRWGNPFPIIDGYVGIYPDIMCGRKLAVNRFRQWLKGAKFKMLNPDTNRMKAFCHEPPSTEAICNILKGKDLACWCALDEACHADVLLEIANGLQEGSLNKR